MCVLCIEVDIENIETVGAREKFHIIR